MSDLLGMTAEESRYIIDDSNASHFANQVSDPSQPFQGGFDEHSVQRGFAAPFSRRIIPRSELDDHIRRQEADRSSPDHWRLAGEVPVMNQANWGYCWMYGAAGAANTCYAMTGLRGIRINPFRTAYLGKNGRNQGGWAGEALEYIERYGLVTDDVWPESVKDNSLLDNHEVELSAKMHGVVEYEELPQNNFDALMSALLDPERPRPVTLGLSWWGHLVYAVKAVKIGNGKYGVKIVNSWKASWGNKGCSVLAESKATAAEQIVIARVTSRVAA